MDSKYELIQFRRLEDINNLEYHSIYLKLRILKLIQRSKKVIPKLISIYKSKVVK